VSVTAASLLHCNSVIYGTTTVTNSTWFITLFCPCQSVCLSFYQTFTGFKFVNEYM